VSASLTAGSAREGLRPHTDRLMAPITADPGRKVYSSGPGSKCRYRVGPGVPERCRLRVAPSRA
jgi:hypothetical protein